MTSQVPPPDEVTQEWWDATREHRLLVQVCGCGHVQHPPRAVCTSCGSTDSLSARESTGAAVVDSWTEVHRAPRPDLEVPYVVARVRLEDGPVLLTNLLGDPSWVIGEQLVLTWRDLEDGRALPVFQRPDATPHDG